MNLSVIYDLGAYDYEIEEGIPSLLLAQTVVTGLQPYHDKPLQIKEKEQVRSVTLHMASSLLYDMEIHKP